MLLPAPRPFSLTKLAAAVAGDDLTAAAAVHAELVRELYGMELAAQKQAAVCDANAREQRMYEQRQQEIQQSIEQVGGREHVPLVGARL